MTKFRLGELFGDPEPEVPQPNTLKIGRDIVVERGEVWALVTKDDKGRDTPWFSDNAIDLGDFTEISESAIEDGWHNHWTGAILPLEDEDEV
jgi:hypothetical protein